MNDTRNGETVPIKFQTHHIVQCRGFLILQFHAQQTRRTQCELGKLIDGGSREIPKKSDITVRRKSTLYVVDLWICILGLLDQKVLSRLCCCGFTRRGHLAQGLVQSEDQEYNYFLNQQKLAWASRKSWWKLPMQYHRSIPPSNISHQLPIGNLFIASCIAIPKMFGCLLSDQS